MLVDRRRRTQRAGLFARRRARQETWAFVRKGRTWLVAIGGVTFVVATVLGVEAMQEALGWRSPPWWTPFLLGLSLGALPCAAWAALTSADGSASWRIGAAAEQWTAEELDGLGPAWRIEHAVPFPGLNYVVDIDHIAIGSHGVMAVETKWTSHVVDLGDRRLAPEVSKAIDQALSNANRVGGLLRRVSGGTDVIPLVVYWGPNVKPPPDSVRREGDVRLVAGGHGKEWRSRLTLDRLDVDDVERLARRVRDWRVEQERQTVGTAVALRLRHAERFGRVSIGFAILMVRLLPLSRASEMIDTVFRVGGGTLAGLALFLPLVAALATSAYVGLARHLDPEVTWVRSLVPMGAWMGAFATLMFAT